MKERSCRLVHIGTYQRSFTSITLSVQEYHSRARSHLVVRLEDVPGEMSATNCICPTGDPLH